ncbi:MAG: Redox-active disulfide protein 2 [Candidatus Ozemobacter sibiricus]|jgi:small redox-active disulfide protein 2|uniref:Redox-active disulfide protein 2 n=1 Tax=Candidatus Ozemobacter sibiricus TaxID=2268124 RepID=A0A367ZV94_9BACT|nr:MAG: Redox-active disulfide protein 2 [Candidatus Ozemobacter sibiricus]
MKIQILGTGCAKCTKLAELAKQAADELNLSYELVKVTNLNEIMGFGVMVTPALAVDGTVKVSGKVPSLDEIKKLLQS